MSVLMMISLILFGLILGLLVALLVYFLDRRWSRRPTFNWRCMPPEQLRRTLQVLQHLQVLMVMQSGKPDPALIDVRYLLRQTERHFGAAASLEDVIQALVGYDLMLQREARLARRMRPVQAVDAEQVTSAPAAAIVSQVAG